MADDPVNASLAAAGQALNDFVAGPVQSAAGNIERAVDRSFGAVARTIAGAALSGRRSMAGLTAAILADFDRIAVSQFIVKPVESLVSSVAGSLLPVAGARAAGGPVVGGQTYLVGEKGPELFTPAGDGAITAHAALTGDAAPAGRAANVTVNITTPDAQSFMKSRSQVASMLARAVAQGNRNL
jgi:phage-related minor tail protein